jgi:hypothetical protein
VSDPKRQDLDFIDHAPAGLHEPDNDQDPVSLGSAWDAQDGSAQRRPYETVAHLRPVEGRERRIQKQPDIFAEAVAKAMQEQLEPEFVEAPSVLQNRRRFGIAGRFAAASGAAAVVALVFVVAFPMAQGPDLPAWRSTWQSNWQSAQSTWQSLKSSLFSAPQRKPAPMLAVRESSGPISGPLSLGVGVNSAGPGTRPGGAFRPCRACAATAATRGIPGGTARCRARGAGCAGNQSQRSRRFYQAGAGTAGERRSAGGPFVAASRRRSSRCPRGASPGEDLRSHCVEAIRRGRS